MKMTHPLTMGTDPTYTNEKGNLCYPCRGSQSTCCPPQNNYHPSQTAWLVENKLYTGRFIVDVGHLPDNLRNL